MNKLSKKMRYELKYYIHLFEMFALRDRLKQILVLDANSITEEGYHIRSLYFDNVHETALHDKSNGVFRRKKYRVRIYNKSDKMIKLERKSKYNNQVFKESATLSKDEYYALMQGDYHFLRTVGNPLLTEFYYDLKQENMKPAVIVDYMREAYIHPITDVRITFDKQLSASVQSFDILDTNLVTREMVTDAQTILEVKYRMLLPQFIRDLVQMSAVHRSAISKYVICKESRKVYSN